MMQLFKKACKLEQRTKLESASKVAGKMEQRTKQERTSKVAGNQARRKKYRKQIGNRAAKKLLLTKQN